MGKKYKKNTEPRKEKEQKEAKFATTADDVRRIHKMSSEHKKNILFFIEDIGESRWGCEGIQAPVLCMCVSYRTLWPAGGGGWLDGRVLGRLTSFFIVFLSPRLFLHVSLHEVLKSKASIVWVENTYRQCICLCMCVWECGWVGGLYRIWNYVCIACRCFCALRGERFVWEWVLLTWFVVFQRHRNELLHWMESGG